MESGGTDPDGNPVSLSGLAAVVHRRQADGFWLYVIDNPFPFE
jgi:ketosteroid isomerase-like protein